MNNDNHNNLTGVNQYAEWKQWSTRTRGQRRRHSDSDLISSELVDPEEERHMYLPMKQQSSFVAMHRSSCGDLLSNDSRHHCNSNNNDLDDGAMVARVVAFFQSVQNQHAIRQMQLEDEQHEERNNDGGSAHRHGQYSYLTADVDALARGPQHHFQHGDTDNDGVDEYCSMTKLEKPSSTVLAEQADIWNRLQEQREQEELRKQQQETNEKKRAASNNNNSNNNIMPVIPEWLHQAAREEGRRIRVVTLANTQTSAGTRSVTCIGCQKQMITAQNVQIVFCPSCGSTFSPELFTQC